MGNKNEKAWYSFAENYEYKGSEPAFFDINHLPWKALLETNYQVFLQELKLLIDANDSNIIPYFNETLANTKTSWTIFPLLIWGKSLPDNTVKCPQTMQLLSSIKGVTSCSFSILKPHSSIRAHHGDSNVMYRVHLTLQSEAGLPDMGMRVKDQHIQWQTGTAFAFCDAHEHEVWNHTDTTRYVLIIDILREPFLEYRKTICAKVNATLFWQLKLQNFYFIKHVPKFMRRGLMNVTALFMKKN